MRYDRARSSLDRHAAYIVSAYIVSAYIVSAYLAGAARTDDPREERDTPWLSGWRVRWPLTQPAAGA
jgi:hypothetical protein